MQGVANNFQFILDSEKQQKKQGSVLVLALPHSNSIIVSDK
jgi:hypothetical protein